MISAPQAEEKKFGKHPTQKPLELLRRVVLSSSNYGDLVLDPFGGSGTTYYVCEKEKRRWIGIELESCDVIIERFNSPDLCPHNTEDFVEK